MWTYVERICEGVNWEHVWPLRDDVWSPNVAGYNRLVVYGADGIYVVPRVEAARFGEEVCYLMVGGAFRRAKIFLNGSALRISGPLTTWAGPS